MDRITVERLDHVAVYVTDVTRARRFYAGLFGLKEVPRPPSFDFPGAWFEMGNVVLHAIGRDAPDTPGPRHFCVWVSDLRAAGRAIAAAGHDVKWEAARHKIEGVERFFTYDPDGNRIEVQGRE